MSYNFLAKQIANLVMVVECEQKDQTAFGWRLNQLQDFGEDLWFVLEQKSGIVAILPRGEEIRQNLVADIGVDLVIEVLFFPWLELEELSLGWFGLKSAEVGQLLGLDCDESGWLYNYRSISQTIQLLNQGVYTRICVFQLGHS